MTIRDTYGDDRRDIDYEEFIASNEKLTKLKVAERLRGNERARLLWDDLLQEARIVQFQVLLKRPESTRAYVSAAMSHRIVECIRRDAWTGSSMPNGHPIDPLRRRDRDSVDDPDVDVVISSNDWLSGVEMAYHHGELAEALSELTFTQKQQVVARFWYGMSEPEIAALQSCSVATVSRRWRTEIRPALVERLRHLEDVVG